MQPIPLYLLALIVAIAATPLDIYKICAWNHGTAKVEPWRSRVPRTVAHRVATLFARVRLWLSGSGGLPALAALVIVALLASAVIGHAQGGLVLAHVVPFGLKAARQRVADLKAEHRDAAKAVSAIGEKAITEKRALTDDERAKRTEAKAKADASEAQLGDAEQILADAETANEADRHAQSVTDPDAASAQAAGRSAGLRVTEDEGDKIAKRPDFMGRYLHAVRRVTIREAQAGDDQLLKIMAGPTGASTDVPSDGGFLIQPQLADGIIQRAYTTGDILPLCDKLPIGANANGMVFPAIDETSRANGSRFGGIASGWLGQGNTTTAGKPKFRRLEMKLRKVGAFVYATDELLVDAMALAAWIGKNLPLELMFRTEDAIINGTGENQPLGILNAGAAVTVTRNTASRVLYEDVSGMWKRMWAPLRKNAVWVIDQSIEQELEQLSIAIGTAGTLAPIYKPATAAVTADGTMGYFPATLYGRPVMTTEYGAALGTVGDIILTDFGEYQLIDKGDVQQMVSLHVAFLTDEAVYRFMYRVDGAPKWHAALTPKSGGSTVTSIVTLT